MNLDSENIERIGLCGNEKLVCLKNIYVKESIHKDSVVALTKKNSPGETLCIQN